jgi:hypothetical protein
VKYSVRQKGNITEFHIKQVDLEVMLYLYVGGAQFKSWPGLCYPDFGFSWFSQVLPGKCQDSTLIKP